LAHFKHFFPFKDFLTHKNKLQLVTMMYTSENNFFFYMEQVAPSRTLPCWHHMTGVMTNQIIPRNLVSIKYDMNNTNGAFPLHGTGWLTFWRFTTARFARIK